MPGRPLRLFRESLLRLGAGGVASHPSKGPSGPPAPGRRGSAPQSPLFVATPTSKKNPGQIPRKRNAQGQPLVPHTNTNTAPMTVGFSQSPVSAALNILTVYMVRIFEITKADFDFFSLV